MEFSINSSIANFNPSSTIQLLPKDFGFSDSFKPDSSIVDIFKKADATATQNGDGKFSKILDFIFKYGGQALTLLTTTGVIKNKNLSSIQNADYNSTAYDNILKQATGGDLASLFNKQLTPQPTPPPANDNSVIYILVGFLIVFLILNK